MVRPLLLYGDMRAIVMGLLLMVGCVAPRTDQPGHAQLMPEPQWPWIVGEENEVTAYWAYACDGTGDWGCPSSTITLLDVTCDGCVVSGDPRGRPKYRGILLNATAATDADITMVARLRFDDTGDARAVSTTFSGDREVAVAGECALIDTLALNQRNPADRVPRELFHSCDTKRLPSETAVVFPVVRTSRGQGRFPFCPTPTLCGFPGNHIRPISSFEITPAPVDWARAERIEPSEFAILPPMPSGGTVSLQVQLAPAGTATASVDIPAIE
jgi:hypothetical protein